MNDILDEIEKNEMNNSKPFSILSFVNAIIFLIVIYLLAGPMLFSGEIKASDSLARPSLFLSYALWGLLISGLILTFLSFFKKEKNTFFKIAGAILNGLFFILALGSILFVYYIDSMH